MAKIMIFGAGRNGKILAKYIKTKTNHQVVGWIDNFRKNSENGEVIRPQEIKNYHYDKIVVTVSSKAARDSIREQLNELHIPKEQIVFLLENDELKTEVFSNVNRYDELDERVNWLKSFAEYLHSEKVQGNVAECGVNRGEFAYFINKFFFDKDLYLFDTFSGFSEVDLDIERSISDESFINGEFNRNDIFLCTNVNIVKQRLMYPERCKFFVGYFPDSAVDIKDEFCFVNLDMDLYKPMLEGLKFFYPKMVSGGVVLLHDYCHPKLPGVYKAVKDYEEEIGKALPKFPIGDYCSIAILK